MSHLHPEDGITGEADWDHLRTTSTALSWWAERTRPSHRPRQWPQALLLIVALGVLVAGMVTADSTTTSTTSDGLLVLEEMEGPGFFLFVVGLLIVGFSMLFWIFDTGITRDTVVFSVLGLGAVGLGAFLLLTTTTGRAVTVDNSMGTITLVEDHVFHTTADQTDLDQVLRVEYRYIPSNDEDGAFAIISLVFDDESSVEIHRGEPETMDQWARAIATHTGLPHELG